MYLRDALVLYLNSVTKERTRINYRGVLEPFVTALGPGRPIQNVTPLDVQTYVNEMRNSPVRFADHPKRPSEPKPLSPHTIFSRIKTIKAFFNFFVRMGVLQFSPASVVRQERLPKSVLPERIATDEEIELIRLATFGNARDHAIFLFLADTGCRAGGAADLLLANLDLKEMQAVVTEKGNKSRMVFFAADCCAALERWLNLRPTIDHPYVFSARRKPYAKLTATAVSDIIERAAIAAGIERPIHSHHIRHWKGMKLAEVTDVSTAALILGHENPQVTLAHYYHTDLSRAKAAVRQTSIQTKRLPSNVIRLVNE